MPLPKLAPDLLRKLKSVDTPTVCNAIEVAQGTRGFANFTRKTLLASDANAPAMVGFARTAKIAAQDPPKVPPEVIRERRMAYYRHMAEAPGPAVCVIEDMDGVNAVGAFWGEINTTVHKGFGLAGTLTNGLMRDLGDMADDYPVLAGGIGPSHAFVHVREIGGHVDIFGMHVEDGDLIHADCHGALVIPGDVLPTLSQAIDAMQASEQIILEAARKPDFDFEAFQIAWTVFEKSRT